MNSHFIQRLIMKSTDKELVTFIRPALTPDVLPSTFLIPRQEYVPSRTTTIIPEKPDESPLLETEKSLSKPKAEIKQDTSVIKRFTKMTPEPEQKNPPEDDVSIPKLVSEPKVDYTSEKKNKIQYIETKYVEAEEVEPKKSMKKLDQRSVMEKKKEPKLQKTAEHIKKQRQTSRLEEEKMRPIENGLLKPPDSRISKPDTGKVIKKEIKKGVESEELIKLVPSESEGIKKPKKRIPVIFTRRHFLPQEVKGLEDLNHPETTVNINIESVEVRAILPERSAIKKEKVPTLSLQDYLKQRQEGN